MSKYQYLEEVEGAKALDFVNKENQKTLDHFKKNPLFHQLQKELEPIYGNKDKIPWPSVVGEYVYNLWTDLEHQRGLWRRMKTEDYENGSPNWETVLDLDKLSSTEGKEWVFYGASFLKPHRNKCLLYLSNGGKDAQEVREFDLVKKEFVEKGFYLPEAKSNLIWINENEIWVATNFGEGSFTASGYARQVKSLKRGQSLEEATLVFEGKAEDMMIYPYSTDDDGKRVFACIRLKSFYETEIYVYEKGTFKLLPFPVNADFKGIFKGRYLAVLDSDWELPHKTFKEGSMVSLTSLEDLSTVEAIFEPTDKTIYVGGTSTKNFMILDLMEDVQNKLQKLSLVGGKWVYEDLVEERGQWAVCDTSDEDDKIFLTSYDFLTPTTLYRCDVATKTKKKLRASPSLFNAEGLSWRQHFAVSFDGTKIPYFIVYPTNMKLDGTNPTLISAYGGFKHVQEPSYLGSIGKLWSSRGGVYVLANLRGGGEYGPSWHKQALKENRHKCFEDLEAVAKDLFSRNITSPKHLGIEGGSNGGLLVGAAFTRKPELYKAVLCEVPLLDMLSYHKLLAGNSWVDEYGSPDDPKERSYLETYSPFHNVFENKTYPEVFFMTSTKDDRVHPYHARAMVAKMRSQGHKVFYFENLNGGHGGSSTTEDSILWSCLEYTYLLEKLK